MLPHCLLERLAGATVLHIAAAAGLVQMVVHLVKAGPRNFIDKQTQAGFTAAALAALGGHTVVLKALQTLHCDTSIVTADGATILHLAVESGDPDVLCFVTAMGGLSGHEQRQVYSRPFLMCNIRVPSVGEVHAFCLCLMKSGMHEIGALRAGR